MSAPKCITLFLSHCKVEKCLSEKTLQAYRSDLCQFSKCLELSTDQSVLETNKPTILEYVTMLNARFKPKTVKRKMAVLKAMYSFFEREEIIQENPFRRIKLRIGRGVVLPRCLPYESIVAIVRAVASEHRENPGFRTLRNLLLTLLLSTTGVRVSEACGIRIGDVDLAERRIRIRGKGNRERCVPVYDESTFDALSEYVQARFGQGDGDALFPGNGRECISDQTVRALVKRLAGRAGVAGDVTPHVFRHSIATYLLELGVDIRNIQALLGHCSIAVTEIYTKVTPKAQMRILNEKFPGVGIDN